MHPSSPQVARPHKTNIRVQRVQRVVLICLAALTGTAIWAAVLSIVSWLLAVSISRVMWASILVGIFLLQLFALSLVAGASNGPNRRNADDCFEGEAPGIVGSSRSAMG